MKKKNKNVKRGNTFVGLAPKVEDRIEIKKRRKEKKHKKKLYEEGIRLGLDLGSLRWDLYSIDF